MKITVNQSAKNSARCRGSRALLNIIAELLLQVIQVSVSLMRSKDNEREPQSNNPNCRVLPLIKVVFMVFFYNKYQLKTTYIV